MFQSRRTLRHRVLQLVERERRPGVRSAEFAVPWWKPWLSLGWARGAAVAAAIFSVSGFSYHQYQRYVRQEVARSVAEVSRITPPSIEMLENFEAIRRLNPAPQKVDVELLAALQ